jgi:hypothetical protein
MHGNSLPGPVLKIRRHDINAEQNGDEYFKSHSVAIFVL